MNIKRNIQLGLGIISMILLVSSCQNKDAWYDNAVATAELQMALAAAEYEPGASPRSLEPDGSVRTSTRNNKDKDWKASQDWTCGFFPGALWYMSELTGNDSLAKEAVRYTEALDEVQYYTHSHDLGFMMYCSYGNALRLTKNDAYKDVLVQTTKSLMTRYNPTVGCIRSWDFGPWQFPVIVDNMMNLEMVCQMAVETGKTEWLDVAVSHANKTMANHFRDDYSSYHVLSYDTISGEAIHKGTFQGYADDSRWARGQTWGLYGYTMMYRYTKDVKYLEMAQNIASLIMNLENMPADKVPYWDYDAPDIPDAPRDASAAAVTASALLELSQYVADGDAYYAYAEEVLKSLSSPEYLAEVGTNSLFVLKHSVGAYPNNSEVDCPINYADYYYLEALKRYKDSRK